MSCRNCTKKSSEYDRVKGLAKRYCQRHDTVVYLWKLPNCDCWEFSDSKPVGKFEVVTKTEYIVIGGVTYDKNKLFHVEQL